jgi:hypothetical protein
LEAEVVLAGAAQRLDHLLERQDQADVIGLAPQAPRDVGEQPGAPGA